MFSDLFTLGNLRVALPGVIGDARAGCCGVRVLSMSETASLVCSFCLNVKASKHSLGRSVPVLQIKKRTLTQAFDVFATRQTATAGRGGGGGRGVTGGRDRGTCRQRQTSGG